MAISKEERSINESLLDHIINHVIDLNHYSNDVVRRMLAVLDRADADLILRLQRALERLPMANFTISRLEHAMADIRALNKVAVNRLEYDLSNELRAFAEIEADFQFEMLRGKLPEMAREALRAIDPSQAYTAAMARPFQGRLLKEWASGIESGKLMRVRDAVRMGYVENQTISEIMQRLRGTKAANFQDGILSIERRNAEAVVRTSIQHMAAFTRERFYVANKDYVSAKVWVSTLDSRTTHQCQVRDGLLYTVDNKPIDHKVPWLSGPGQLHWNCRSTSAPIIKGWDELGLKLPIGQRASMNGAVPADVTYKQWLVKQPASRQDQILGPVRGALLREGKLEIDRFWTDRGAFLTLNELRSRNAAAFRLP